MTEQPESNKPQNENEYLRELKALLKVLITICVILLFSFILYVGLFLERPIVVNRTHFADSVWNVYHRMINGIIDMERGVQVERNREIVSIIDKEEFVAGLLEFIRRQVNMRRFFDAGIFKILVQDNFCFIRVDINAASRHRSHLRIDLRDAIARHAAIRSRRIFDSFETNDDALDWYRSEPGSKPYVFLGNSNMNSPVAFTGDMNYFYMLTFLFSNDPPISISAFP